MLWVLQGFLDYRDDLVLKRLTISKIQIISHNIIPIKFRWWNIFSITQNLCLWGFHNLEPNDVLLSSRDLPIFKRFFSKKDCLSPFLSAAKPIPLDRGYYLTTPLHWIHTIIPKFFLLSQKMIVVLPHKCLFCFAIFLRGGTQSRHRQYDRQSTCSCTFACRCCHRSFYCPPHSQKTKKQNEENSSLVVFHH